MSKVPYEVNQEALGLCIAAKAPVILWGDPGQGKTSVLEALATDMESNLTTLISSIREPSDFAGLPNIVNGRTCLVAPNWAYDIQENGKNGGKDILFFDEISTAVPATQAALLRVILDRVVGDVYLGDHVSIVAAANPTAIAADGWDLAAPMANRFVHLDWELPARVFADGLASSWPSTPVPQVDEKKLAEELQKAKILVGAFVAANVAIVTKMPTNLSGTGGAFPTPRSWEMASRLFGYAKAANASDLALHQLIAGTVGEAPSLEFFAFIEKLDLPDPETILKDPKSWKISQRGDQTFAIAFSILAALKQNNTEARWLKAGQVMAIMADAGHNDIAVSFGFRWMKELRPNDSIMVEGPILKSISPLLKKAGLLG